MTKLDTCIHYICKFNGVCIQFNNLLVQFCSLCTQVSHTKLFEKYTELHYTKYAHKRHTWAVTMRCDDEMPHFLDVRKTHHSAHTEENQEQTPNHELYGLTSAEVSAHTRPATVTRTLCAV